MSTATVQITRLPPGVERKELHFDRCHFIQGRLPVSAEFTADGVVSPGLSFSDYQNMHSYQRKQSGERRLPTPAWALNDGLLRKVLVRYIETRAGFHSTQPGTEQERLARAQQRILKTKPERIATLGKLCKELVALKQSGAEPARLRKLQVEISNLDTVIRFDGCIAATVVGVVNLYYRVGLDSVGVATELNLKPPHIRQLIWRLARVWERMETGWVRPKSSGCRRRTQIDVALAAQLRAEGKTENGTAAALGCSWRLIRDNLKTAGLYKRKNQHFRPKAKQRTLGEHVALLEKLARHNHGKVPTRTWLNAHGFWGTYEVARKNPEAFAHLKRETEWERRKRN